MNEGRHYSFTVIGGGPAGYGAALRFAELDPSQAVCLIEMTEEKIGGTCLNEGCIPVKSLAESASLYEHLCRSAEFGLSAIVQEPEADKILSSGRKNMVQLRQGVLSLLKNKKVDIIYGEASFLSAKEIQVKTHSGSLTIGSDNTLVAAGSIPKPIAAFPVNGRNVVNSTELLRLEKIPKKLLVIGGGAIGCEFASIYHRLGSKVTIIEMLPHLLPSEDEDVSRALEREFQKQGIRVMTGAKVNELDGQQTDVKAVLDDNGSETTESFDTVLVAVGRLPNTSGLNLDKAGIKPENGFIPVDGAMRTSIGHIFAAGDVVTGPAYAHTAAREGVFAAEAALGRKISPVNFANIPRIVFTEPQVGSVGLTEMQASKNGIETLVQKKFFKSNGKAVVLKNTAGFVKIISDKKSGKVLGASIVGPSATELVHELALAVQKELTVGDIASLVHGHPTLSELTGDTCA